MSQVHVGLSQPAHPLLRPCGILRDYESKRDLSDASPTRLQAWLSCRLLGPSGLRLMYVTTKVTNLLQPVARPQTHKHSWLMAAP